MPIFHKKEPKTARVEITNPTAGALTYTAQLYLGNKVASSAVYEFAIGPGAKTLVDFAITMPDVIGVFPVYLDVFVAGVLIGAYRAEKAGVPDDVEVIALPLAQIRLVSTHDIENLGLNSYVYPYNMSPAKLRIMIEETKMLLAQAIWPETIGSYQAQLGRYEGALAAVSVIAAAIKDMRIIGTPAWVQATSYPFLWSLTGLSLVLSGNVQGATVYIHHAAGYNIGTALQPLGVVPVNWTKGVAYPLRIGFSSKPSSLIMGIWMAQWPDDLWYLEPAQTWEVTA